jgi:hypothetical protein
MRKRISDESGQAVVEYMLTLLTVVTVVTILATGFRRSLVGLWQVFTRDIAAACPGCPADPSIRIR